MNQTGAHVANKLSTLALSAAAIATVLLASGSLTHADSTTPQTAVLPGVNPSQSAAIGPGSTPGFKPGPTLSYLGWYYGPSVTAPGSPYQPTTGGYDNNVGVLNEAGVMNYISAGYKVTPDITILGVAKWWYTPMLGGDYVWQDPYLKLVDAAIWKSKGWLFNGDARIYIPATQTSQAAGNIFQFRVTPNIQYSPPGTKWTFALTGYAWSYIDGTYGTGDTVDFYLAPNLAYQLTPTLAATLLYELYGHNSIEGLPPYINTNDPTDFNLGVSWDITPWLNASPYIQFYPGSFSWSSTSFAGTLSATVF